MKRVLSMLLIAALLTPSLQATPPTHTATTATTRTAPPPVAANFRTMTRQQIIAIATLSDMRKRGRALRDSPGSKGAIAPNHMNAVIRPVAHWVRETIPMTPRRSWTDLTVAKNPDPALSLSHDVVDASVYSDTTSPLTLEVHTSGYARQNQRYLIQYASQPTPTHAPDRCAAWTTPAALIATSPLILHFLPMTSAPTATGRSIASASVASSGSASASQSAYAHAGIVQASRPMALHTDSVPHIREPLHTVTTFTALLPQSLGKPLTFPATIWMRLVPLDASSVCNQAPSNWISIYTPGTRSATTMAVAKAREDTIVKEHAAAVATIKSHYTVKVLSYIPPKLYDDGGFFVGVDASHFIILARDHFIEGQLWQAGATIDAEAASALFKPQPGLFGQMWDLATGELNLVSGAYETAKDAVVGVVAGALNFVGISCQEPCKAVLKTGLETALAYCGIPPKIPNLAELYSRGAGYLAQSVASVAAEAITGIDLGQSDSLLGTAIEETAKAEAKKQAFEGAKKGIDLLTSQLVCIDPSKADCAAVAENPYTWGPPAPYFRSRPGVIWVRITRTGPADPASEKITTMTVTLGTQFNAKSTYDVSYIPADGLTIPIVLDPVNPDFFAHPSGTEYHRHQNDDRFYPAEVGEPYFLNAPKIELDIFTSHVAKSSIEKHGVTTSVSWVHETINSGEAGSNPMTADYYGRTVFKDVNGSILY